MDARPRWNLKSEADVSPLISIALLLLVIVVALQPAIVHEPVPPRASTSTPEAGDQVTLGIDYEGTYWLIDQDNPGPIPPEMLVARLAPLYAASSEDHVLYLKADRRIPYRSVLIALNAARQLGVRRLAMITECPRGKETLLPRCGA